MIDTSITRPDYLFDERPSAEVGGVGKPNAVFKTAFEHIEVKLWVKGGGVVDISAEKTDGGGHCWLAVVRFCFVISQRALADKLRMKVDRQLGTTLKLSASSRQDVRVSIPSSFNGRVVGGSERGLVTFSPALKARTRTFSTNQQDPLGGKYWIGEFDTALFQSVQGVGKRFEGDSLTVKSERGDILIETWEEREEEDEVKARVVLVKPWLANVLGATGDVLNAVLNLVGACFGQ